MGKYNGAVITTAGQNLIAQAIAESKTVTFTTAQASSHVYPSSTDFEALTALTDVEKTVDINYAGVYSDTVVQVSARFDNDGVDTAYLINTLGFFAQLGTDTPILFAVSTAVTPDQMPVFDADNPSAFIYNMQITVQNANSINVSVNPAGTVTVDQLNTVVSIINAKIGDLSNLTTDDKSSVVDAINEVDAHADAAQTSANIVQAQVSNSGDAYGPTKPYTVGELCIYNNVLYRCTTACSAGSWATNQSCFTADTLTGVANNTIHKVGKRDLLWTNPEGYFWATSLQELPLDGYDEIEILFSFTSLTAWYSQRIKNIADTEGYISAWNILEDTSSDALHAINSCSRKFTIHSNGITWGNGSMIYNGSYYGGPGSEFLSNRAVPREIYGIKY